MTTDCGFEFVIHLVTKYFLYTLMIIVRFIMAIINTLMQHKMCFLYSAKQAMILYSLNSPFTVDREIFSVKNSYNLLYYEFKLYEHFVP